MFVREKLFEGTSLTEEDLEVALNQTEVQENRIACVAVLLEENSGQAELLGCYLSQEENELLDNIEIYILHQLDILLDHFNWLEQISVWGGLTNLKSILEGLLDKGWEKSTFADL